MIIIRRSRVVGLFLGAIGLVALLIAGIELFVLTIKFDSAISGLEWIGLVTGLSGALLFRIIREPKTKQTLLSPTC